MRLSRILAAIAALALCGVAPSSVGAQIVKVGYSDVGGVVGLGGIGDAGLSIGGRYERIIRDLPDLGNGLIGVNVSVDRYSWSSAFASVSYLPVGVTANYHFPLADEKIVPFVGLGLGYQIVNCDVKGLGGNPCANSGIYTISRAGVRYFYKPNLAFYADAGAGAATLNVGITYKLK